MDHLEDMIGMDEEEMGFSLQQFAEENEDLFDDDDYEVDSFDESVDITDLLGVDETVYDMISEDTDEESDDSWVFSAEDEPELAENPLSVQPPAETEPAPVINAPDNPGVGLDIVESSQPPKEEIKEVDPQSWQRGKKKRGTYTRVERAPMVEMPPAKQEISIIDIAKARPLAKEQAPLAPQEAINLQDHVKMDPEEPENDFVVRFYYTQMVMKFTDADLPTAIAVGKYFIGKIKNGLVYNNEAEDYITEVNRGIIASSTKTVAS